MCGPNLAVDGSEDSLIHCLQEGQPCHSGLEVFNSQLSILSEPDVNPFQPFVPGEEVVADAAPEYKLIDASDEEDEIDIEL